jgi:hypothetical protein
VRAIAVAHDAELTARARPEGGLDITVSFPGRPIAPNSSPSQGCPKLTRGSCAFSASGAEDGCHGRPRPDRPALLRRAITGSGARWISFEGRGVVALARDLPEPETLGTAFVAALDGVPIALASGHGDVMTVL